MVTFQSIEETVQVLQNAQYICDRSLGTSIYLSIKMEKPLLLEGEAGVGKTEVANVLAEVLRRKLIRIQCYEGLDSSAVIYEWNYPKQLLRIKTQEIHPESQLDLANIFTEEFLIKRPLLEAIRSESQGKHVVLLIDEIDRSDEEFEAFLLESLSDFQISIPEIGTIYAQTRPTVVITSNRTRDLNDAIKRRCIFHWIDYPSFEKEHQILTTKVPEIEHTLATQLCNFMQRIRAAEFHKKPGIAETLDWAHALMVLERNELDEITVRETIGCILKYQEDIERFRKQDLSAYRVTS